MVCIQLGIMILLCVWHIISLNYFYLRVHSHCLKVALVKCELSQLILESTQEKLVRGLTWIQKTRSCGWILKLLWSKKFHGLPIFHCRSALLLWFGCFLLSVDFSWFLMLYLKNENCPCKESLCLLLLRAYGFTVAGLPSSFS